MIERESEYIQLLANTRTNASRRGIDFKVSTDQFLRLAESQGGTCSVTGMEFDFRPAMNGKKRPFYPSIDRIDSSVGYTIGNIRLVVQIANYAMNEWGEEPLFEMVDAIIEFREINAERERKHKEMRERLPKTAETKEKYIGREEAAEYIKSLGLEVAKGTLQKWATTGGGPAYRKFGKRCVYLVSDLNEWVLSKISKPMASTTRA